MFKNNWVVRLLLVCLATALLGGTLAGCSGSKNPEQETSGTTNEPSGSDAVVLCENGEVKTQIVFSSAGDKTVQDAATRLQARLAEVTGVTVPVHTDEATALGNEILLGATAHSASPFQVAESEVMVAESNGNVFLLAGDSSLWNAAIELLITELKQSGNIWYVETGLSVRKTVEPQDIPLRVAIFNIQMGGEAVNYNLSVLGQDIINTGADIIGLVEVDENTFRNKRQHTMKLLGEQMGYYYYFGAEHKDSGGYEGNGLLSKYPIESADCVELPATQEGEEPRTALRAQINVNGTKLHVYVVHLNQWSVFPCLKAINQLAKDTDPFIVVGDFNYEYLSVYSRYFPNCSAVNNPDNSFATTYDGYKFDNIILSQSLELTKAWTVDTTDAGGKRHSDHFMLVADVKIILPES